MAELRREMEKLKLENVATLLNSGNVLFDADPAGSGNLGKTISRHLQGVFGFPIPTIVRKATTISQLVEEDLFRGVTLTKDISLYVSFLHKELKSELPLPWTSEDKSFKIIGKQDKAIFSILDLSLSPTTAAMGILERYFGKDITTRNWKTIQRLEKKLGTGH
jgi:uncharacterized protein (DUF1697 family)